MNVKDQAIASNTEGRTVFQWIELIVVISLVLIFGWATYQRNFIWKDNLTLWSDVVKKSPNKARGHNNLGIAYSSRGLIDRAVEHYLIAIKLNPDYPEAHYNLGITYIRLSDRASALREYEMLKNLDPQLANKLFSIISYK